MAVWLARAGIALGLAVVSAGAGAAVATFQIDVTGCTTYGSSGSCAGFKPSSFQATWTYDETASPAAMTTSTNAQGNAVAGSSLKLSATLSSPYAVTAQQLADVGVKASDLSSYATASMTRTTTPGGAVVGQPYQDYTVGFEQSGYQLSFANGVSTTRMYESQLFAYQPLPTTLSPVSGGTLQSFLQSAPLWSFDSTSYVYTFVNGVVTNVAQSQLYGVARYLAPLAAVPEPAESGMLLAGLAVMGLVARRRRLR